MPGARRVLIRPQANADLDDIWLNIARDNPAAADNLIDRFSGRFESLRHNPEIGLACPELGEGLRRLVVDDYLIFYSISESTLIVERVLHGARDIGALFN